MAAFEAYDWPGNIRELQNVVERGVILSDAGVLPNPLPARRVAVPATGPTTMPATLRDSERALILGALEAVGWVVGGPDGAAARLGLNRTTLINMMKRLGIERPTHAGLDPGDSRVGGVAGTPDPK
jgi:formate hydrogenlyase transcriptional activator